MRVKLQFDSSLQFGQRQKVCFYIPDDSCKKVADLTYLIQKRFYSKSNGNLNLFLDEFYIPPGENIDVIKENDVLNVQFTASGKKGKCKQITRKEISSDSATSSSSSSSEEEEEPKKKKQRIDTKVQNNHVNSNGNVKKVIPLSKLGISKKKVKESSSSSSSSESESENEISKKKPTQVNNVKTKTSKPVVNGKNSKKQIVKIDSSSSSDSTSESESSDECSVVGKSKQTVSFSKEDSKVDFDIKGLSSNATSTPGVNSACRVKSILKTPLSNDNSFGKRVAAKDKYKNISQVFTYTPPTDQSQNQSTEQTQDSNAGKAVSIIDISTEPSLLNGKTSQNTSTSQINTSDGNPVSGKTLRNRRRRQRKIEQNRIERNKNKDMETKNGDDDVEQNNNESKEMVRKNEDIVEDPQKLKKQEQIQGKKKDYEDFTIVQDCPPVNSLIAFKVWDMDEKYQPFVSEYKEAKIISYDDSSKQVELKMCDGFTLNDKRSGRFEMETSEAENSDTEEKKKIQETSNVFEDWKALLQPRLLKSGDENFDIS